MDLKSSMRRVLPAAAAAALIAGCGGSDSDDETPPAGSSAGTRVMEERYVAQVDAACKEATPELTRIMAAVVRARDAARAGQADPSQTFDTFARHLRRAGVVTERLESRLRTVEPPKGERSFHDALLESVEEGASNLRRQVAAAEARDANRLRDLSVRGSVLSAKGKGLIAGHGGFRFCGRG